MENSPLYLRLEAYLKLFEYTHYAGGNDPSATKGNSRADFVKDFLSQVLPQSLRISKSGVAIDQSHNKTGELDIIIENGELPSFPINILNSDSRLFFAEGIAAVIEVKSDLSNQFSEALSTGLRVKELNKARGKGQYRDKNRTVIVIPGSFPDLGLGKVDMSSFSKIPFFIIGYKGWEQKNTLISHFEKHTSHVDGIFQLDKGFFITNESFGSYRFDGLDGYLGFIEVLNYLNSTIKNLQFDLTSYIKK